MEAEGEPWPYEGRERLWQLVGQTRARGKYNQACAQTETDLRGRQCVTVTVSLE